MEEDNEPTTIEIVDISDTNNDIIENNQQQNLIILEIMKSILKEVVDNAVKDDEKDLEKASDDELVITMEKTREIEDPLSPTSNTTSGSSEDIEITKEVVNEPEIVENLHRIGEEEEDENDDGIVILSSGDGSSGSGSNKKITKTNEEQFENVILIEEKNNVEIMEKDIFDFKISEEKAVENKKDESRKKDIENSKEIVSGILDDLIDQSFSEANTPSIVVDNIIDMFLEETIRTSFTETDIKDMLILEGKF